MPLLVGFALVALFIWFTENLGAFTGAWIHYSPRAGWSPVSFAKFVSWLLQMLISNVPVTQVRRPTVGDRRQGT